MSGEATVTRPGLLHRKKRPAPPRQVNALEFRLITLNLVEVEPGNLSRLMRIKEIARAR